MREIYEMAVEAEPPYSLSDADCKTMCIRYARLETKVPQPSTLKPCHAGAGPALQLRRRRLESHGMGLWALCAVRRRGSPSAGGSPS